MSVATCGNQDMLVKELIAHLQKLDQEAICVSASDDEGNSYSELHYKPSLGWWYDRQDFHSDGAVVENAEDSDQTVEEYIEGMVRAVCVN